MNGFADGFRALAQGMADDLVSSGYQADFSLESLSEIDRMFDEQSRDGEALADGLLGDEMQVRMLTLGAYVGETIIRHHGGAWQSVAPTAVQLHLGAAVSLPGGGSIWPMRRVWKRLRNGEEDSIALYGRMVGLPG